MAESKTKASMQSVLHLKSPKDHVQRIKELKAGRWEHEREWRLNHAFYNGNQYAFFPKRSTNLVTLATEPSELPRYRVRLVSNQILPGVRSLVAKLTKTKPVMHASPSVATEKASRGAKLAERLMEHLWRKLHLDAKRNEAWTWAQIAGQGWWLMGWDFNSGDTITYTIDPEGKPIVSDKIADVFREQMAAQGAEAIEAAVSVGECAVTVIPPFDVLLDPSPTDYTECNYAYTIHRVSADEAYSRWGVWLKPDSKGGASLQEIPSPTGPGDEVPRDLVTVYCGYFRKSKVQPKGRYIVFSEQHEKFLYDGEWPFPFDELPLVKFPGVQVPGSVYDRALTSDARPLQQDLNRSLSQIVEFKNLNILPQFIAPAGSMQRNRMTGEPGAIWFYNPTSIGGAAKPEPIQLGNLPPYIFEHLGFIYERIREIYNMSGTSEGNMQGIPNVEAGVAIDLLQETAIDQLEPTIQQGEIALARSGQMLLKYAQTYYDEPRLAKLQGGRIGEIQAFKKSDIEDVDIFVEAGSGIPRTRAGRMMRLEKLVQLGVLNPAQSWRYYDMADMKTVAARFAQDEEKAYRENDLLMRQIPLNQLAQQNILPQLQQGINPQTGMELSSMEEAQAILMDAGFTPHPADNHAVEMEVHAMSMKSEEFQSYPPEVQRAFFTHFEKHKEALQAASTEAPQPPKVSYTIRGTAGPQATSKILQSGGVQGVTPEELTEPPLETWVSDSMDKPDLDEAANDPFSQLDLYLLEQKIREQEARASLMEKRARAAKFTVKGTEK